MTVSTTSIAPDKPCTAGALSPDLLTGSLVRLWHYQPGVYGRDALYRVWKLMEDDGATKRAFWDEAYLDTGGDCASFISAFEGAANKILLLVERLDTGLLCGCIWVTQVVPGHQAFTSQWMQRSARGRRSLEAAQLVLRGLFEVVRVQQVWAMTPWLAAGALCRRLGFVQQATLPDYCIWEYKTIDVTLYRLTKAQWEDSCLPMH